VSVDLTLGMSGLACAAYTTAEVAVVKVALAATIAGAGAGGFGAHECSDTAAASRRLHRTGRALLSDDAIEVLLTAAVDSAAYDGSAGAVVASVSATVSSAVATGGFAASVAAAVDDANLTSLAAVSVDSAVAVGSPTPAPTAAPVLSPAVVRKTVQRGMPTLMLLLTFALLFFCFVLGVAGTCAIMSRRNMANSKEGREAVPSPQHAVATQYIELAVPVAGSTVKEPVSI